jgi:hypothetical protein
MHSIPGRTRLKISATQARYGPFIADLIRSHPAIREARWNELSRSLTITHDRALSLAELVVGLPIEIRPASDAAPAVTPILLSLAAPAAGLLLTSAAAELPLRTVTVAASGKLMRALAIEILEMLVAVALGELVGLAFAALLGAALANHGREQPREQFELAVAA